MLCDPLNYYFITIFPLPFLYIITGIISLNILNPPLDRKVTFSLYEKLNEASPRAARGSAWPRIISFPLDNLINFFKKYTQGFKKKVTRLKEKGPQPKVTKYWEKTPKYNTLKLSRDTTVHQVSDWIKEINLGNKRKDTDKKDKAY